MTYYEQMQQPEWVEFKARVMKHYYYKCHDCPKGGATVHHPFRDFTRLAWEYSVEQVMLLCWTCHTRREDQERTLKHFISLHMAERQPSWMYNMVGLGFQKYAAKSAEIKHLPSSLISPVSSLAAAIVIGKSEYCDGSSNPFVLSPGYLQSTAEHLKPEELEVLFFSEPSLNQEEIPDDFKEFSMKVFKEFNQQRTGNGRLPRNSRLLSLHLSNHLILTLPIFVNKDEFGPSVEQTHFAFITMAFSSQ